MYFLKPEATFAKIGLNPKSEDFVHKMHDLLQNLISEERKGLKG
jgi:hypothetical protein